MEHERLPRLYALLGEDAKQRVITRLNLKLAITPSSHVSRHHKIHAYQRKLWYNRLQENPYDRTAQICFLLEQNLSKGYPTSMKTDEAWHDIWGKVNAAFQFNVGNKKYYIYEDRLKLSLEQMIDCPFAGDPLDPMRDLTLRHEEARYLAVCKQFYNDLGYERDPAPEE